MIISFRIAFAMSAVCAAGQAVAAVPLLNATFLATPMSTLTRVVRSA